MSFKLILGNIRGDEEVIIEVDCEGIVTSARQWSSLFEMYLDCTPEIKMLQRKSEKVRLIIENNYIVERSSKKLYG